MKNAKRRFVLPLLVFLIGMAVLGGVVYSVRNYQQKDNREMARLNAMTYAERMEKDISEGIQVTDTLEQIIISENGKIDKFSTIAQNMMTDAIQSIQIAPDGVVTDIYPEEENVAEKIDLIHDETYAKLSCYARDSHVMIMQGPFELKQGGSGIAVRQPVYLENEDGQVSFWGFTIVIIRVPDIFADSTTALSEFGYEYKLSKTVSQLEPVYEEVDSSGVSLTDPVVYHFTVGDSQWKLEIMPKGGWSENGASYAVLGGGFLIVLLLTVLNGALIVLNEHRKKFRKLAITDALTGIYNRHGFDEKVKKYLKQYSDTPCVAVMFDIDDFKFINDMYGHEAGDIALKLLAESMQKFFSRNVVLGRNGGDEFCIFLPGRTCEDLRMQMEQFTKLKRTFIYEGKEHSFSISLGYAEYPLNAKSESELMRCADEALYEVKLRGKNGCLAYQEGQQIGVRTRLGFALKDISENLPGAFLIYKADKNDDEILYANSEMIHLAGCRTMEGLLTYTKRSFHNLILEEERAVVKQSIWQQIDEGDFNDYVYFHLKKADGSVVHVLDHGRIVENGRYGKVFYVMFVNWDFIKEQYKDPF